MVTISYTKLDDLIPVTPERITPNNVQTRYGTSHWASFTVLFKNFLKSIWKTISIFLRTIKSLTLVFIIGIYSLRNLK